MPRKKKPFLNLVRNRRVPSASPVQEQEPPVAEQEPSAEDVVQTPGTSSSMAPPVSPESTGSRRSKRLRNRTLVEPSSMPPTQSATVASPSAEQGDGPAQADEAVPQPGPSGLTFRTDPPSRSTSQTSISSVSTVSSSVPTSLSRPRLTDEERKKKKAENSKRYRLRKKAEREAAAAAIARPTTPVATGDTTDQQVEALSQEFQSVVGLSDVVSNIPPACIPPTAERMEVEEDNSDRAVSVFALPVQPEQEIDIDNDRDLAVAPAEEDRPASIFTALNDSWRNAVAIDVGEMNLTCLYCQAKYFPGEATERQRQYNKCCGYGKVKLNPYPGENFPQALKDLFLGGDDQSVNFQKFIRNYNNSFALAATTVTNDQTLRASLHGRGPSFIFRVQGEIRHVINTNLNVERRDRDDRVLFFFDPLEAVRVRMGHAPNHECREDVFLLIENILRDVNPFVESLRHLKDVLDDEEERVRSEGGEINEVCLVFATRADTDPRTYNAPRCNEVAAVFTGSEPPPMRGVRVYTRRGMTLALSPYDVRIDAMTYPIFYPLGDRGWHVNMRSEGQPKPISMGQFFAYRFQVRGDFNPVLSGKRLTQQYLTDCWVKVEGNRLGYLREHQRELRAECYQGLIDHLDSRRLRTAEELGRPIELGRMVILPSTFVGGPRFMQQAYQDAMAIVAREGRPDLFITMTCNPKWPEIQRCLRPGEKTEDRPDIAVRVFHLKFHRLLRGIVKDNWLGRVSAYFYTIEFQKRGLPHAHLLIILNAEDKFRLAADVDDVVSCEIPREEDDPVLFALVKKHLLHGPCGVDNPNSPCMRDGVCSKKFPKDFVEETQFSNGGYPRYRRRDDGNSVVVRQTRMDNRSVVPYNRYLLKTIESHVNVEVCSSIKAVKYITKYLHKGQDSATIAVTSAERDDHDEIQDYIDMRYVTASEAAYRLSQFEMHGQSHTIHRLPVHLPDRQTVFFREANDAERIVAEGRETMLTAWFKLNQSDPRANQYLYTEIPDHYVWVAGARSWKIRERRVKSFSRMYHVSMRDTERYYLRLLLLHVRGAKCFEDVRTHDGVVYEYFREAAVAMDLIENDVEAARCLREAVAYQMPAQLRALFAMIVLFNNPPNKLELWEAFKNDLSENFTRRGHDQDESYELALFDVRRRIMEYQGDFNWAASGLPPVDEARIATLHRAIEDAANTTDLTPEQHAREAVTYRERMNADQQCVFDRVMNAVDDESVLDRCFHLDGAAGTGKSFVYNALIHHIRSTGRTVIAVASTGIAATLLENGSTVHSAFRLPVPLDSASTSRISRNHGSAPAIRNAKLIVWDEVTMSPGNALVVVDRLLKDLCPDNAHLPFAGKCILLGGDFRQCLPVVTRGRRADILEACVTNCPLWSHFQTLRLAINVRSADEQFAQWLLDIGSGSTVSRMNGVSQCVEIDQRYIVADVVEKVYGARITVDSVESISDRIILSPFNEDVAEVNERVLEKLEGDVVSYYSVDSHVHDGGDEQEAALLDEYSIEFLNSLTPNGLPPHKLNLKVGAVVMLIRNLNVAAGLMNGGRFIVRALGSRVIKIESCFGKHRGKVHFLPRIYNIQATDEAPFQFRRKQFPVRLAFAMTINKSQGQSFDKVGLFLPRPVFTHGQLYVALSRCRTPQNLCIQVTPGRLQGSFEPAEERRVVHYTKNIVFNLDALR